MSLTSAIPFASDEPAISDSPSSWLAFKKPKLSRFPGPGNALQLEDYLGGGEDGLVFRAHIAGKCVAVKVFRDNRQPDPIYGAERYWAFERECTNCALLQMIKSTINHSISMGRAVFLHPDPTTKRHALRNLWAFSQEGFETNPPDHFKELSLPSIPINDCFGWAEIPGHAINQATPDALGISNEETYLCIVYDFVPQTRLDPDAIISQMDFFHAVGFDIVPFNPANWLGEGVLVDFSDISSPFSHILDWNSARYAEYHILYGAAVRGLARKGLL